MGSGFFPFPKKIAWMDEKVVWLIYRYENTPVCMI